MLLQILHTQIANAEEIWSPFSLEQHLGNDAQQSKLKDSKNKAQNSTVNSKLLTKKNSSLLWTPISLKGSSPKKNLIWKVLPNSKLPFPTKIKSKSPKSFEEAQAMLNAIKPRPEDYLPPLRLGMAVPTANQVTEMEGARFSAYQISPFTGGEAGGTGNQNYAARVDYGVSERLQISGFVSEADDPLYSSIVNRAKLPGNFWRSYGAAFQWNFINSNAFQSNQNNVRGRKLAFIGSIEAWEVGSGGSKGQDGASPNIFNDSGKLVFTRNLVGSVALPLTWNSSAKWQTTITPGVSFLPATQGDGQGGAGEFYGNNVWLAGGGLWQPIPEIGLFSSALMPFGPGTNSFDSNLNFKRVPIYSGGLAWNLNPRISLEGTLTNGWGATPATALLTLPSSNRLGYSARFHYTYDAPDTPQNELSRRQLSLASGGVTVNTALVPPDGTTQLWANVDNEENFFGSIRSSISNIFQLQLTNVGWFNNVPQTNDLATTYATDKGWNWRIGGKAVSLSPLRGAPLWVAGRVTLGRNKDPASNQGYVFAESIQTWEANNWLALNLNTKGAWSGISNPWGIGMSANVQLSKNFQLIPEGNFVLSDKSQTNGTLSLRWLANDSLNIDIYASNAAGLMDMGQLLKSLRTRFGAKLSLMF
ncbi:hypothetical protein [Prochlorococcus sp. MIT 1307]|uniref:hypothetical protein n=1 Tax=Prochlorococcus sp. MIT 1307 TaxID=3096219 RepID=UPI002A753042|nr:hypothetical protein [Prochlorococcus sp. MIT 1307]